MKSIFIFSFLTAALVVSSFVSFGQCTQAASITAPNSYPFNTSAQGFTGDFSYNNSQNNLQSTPVSSGTTKVLTSTTFFAPNNFTTLQFGFDFGGNSPVSDYSLAVRYFSGGAFQTVNLCTSATTPLTGSNQFSFSAPSQIIGNNFQIVLTFTLSGNGGQTITIDNFITNAGAANTVLPITLSGFSAVQNASNVTLSWNNLAETNIVNYAIERSADGSVFTQLASLQPSQNDGNRAKYQFTDANPLGGSNLYRVKVEELSGKVSYSTIVRISLSGSSSLQVYPNPIKGNLLGLQINNLPKGDYAVRVFNGTGQVVSSSMLKHPGGSVSQTLSLSNVPRGLYTVEVSGTTKLQTQVVVE